MKQKAWLVVLILVLLTGFLSYRMTKVKFDYDFEKFFPADDPDTEFFLKYRKIFESDNDYVLIGIVNKKGVFDSDFLIRVDSLSQKLAEVPNIRSVISLLNYTEPVKSSFGPIVKRPALHIDNPDLYASDSALIFEEKLLTGSLISEDAKSLSIVLNTKQYLSKKASDSLAVDLNKVVAGFQFDELHIAGRSVGQSYYVKLMQTELLFFAATSMLLVIVFLWFSFKTFWGIWVPIIVVLVSTIWIIGCMELANEGINLVLTILPTIIFVVGMSDVVHIISHYIDDLREGYSKIEALKKTYREVALATFLTSFTTAIGFLTLLVSKIEPVRDFGLYTAIGVMIAYVLAYTLLPAVLILRPAPKLSGEKVVSTSWRIFLNALLRFVIRRRKGVLLGSLLLFVVSIIGMTNLRINNFLLEDLKNSDPLKQNFVFFEKNFSGVRPFEMGIILKTPKDTLPKLKVLKELEKMEGYLRLTYGTGFILSPNSVISQVNKALHAGDQAYYSLPDTQEELDKIVRMVERYKAREIYAMVSSEENSLYRIRGKCADLGSYVYKEKNAALRKFYRTECDTTLFDYRLTGTAMLIDKNNGNLSFGMVTGLLISFVVIALIVGLMFFSWKMIIISLIPNILPIAMIGGLMGFIGIDLKVSTSMIFTIAFGIAVDDTIHFLSRLRYELKSGKSLRYSVKRTFLTTGKAIFVTSIILSAGFMTLIFSDFLGTFYIGFLIGLTLILAVLGDMLLLPVLVLMFYGKKENK